MLAQPGSTRAHARTDKIEPVNAARLEPLKTLVREHKLFSAALAVGAFLRLIAMLGYPGALWFAGDSYVYLGAALRPQPNLSKSTGYSFFLRALLPFHCLTLVTVVQHLMGLAVAVMIYVLLRRNNVSKIWSTAATLPVLLDGYIIEDEHLIMAETLFTFLLMLAMLLILWRTGHQVVDGADRRAARRLRRGRPDRRRGHARRLPAVPAPSRLVTHGWKTCAAGSPRGDRDRLRDPRRRVHELVPRQDRALRRHGGHGLLPVGPGVVVRRLRGDQADRREKRLVCPKQPLSNAPRRATSSGTRPRCTPT